MGDLEHLVEVIRREFRPSLPYVVAYAPGIGLVGGAHARV